MAEENKHPPTTEEQAPPEMPGKAPEMEQAEIPDVGGGPAPSAKVIDLSAMRSTPEKDAPLDIPKETEAPSVSVTEYRVYKGSDWADSEISLDLEDLVAELAALCDPYYEHEQPIYEL